MKVLWLTFIPSPYRCRFFEMLGGKCELTVLFERATSNLRGNNWDDFHFEGYNGKILPGVTIGGHDRFCPSVRKYLLDKSYDRIVISNPTSPTGIYAAAVLKAHGIKYMVESDGAFPSGTSGIKAKLKSFVMADAEVCFSTAKTHDEYYMESGVKKENLRRYPFTSIGEEDIRKAQEKLDALNDLLPAAQPQEPELEQPDWELPEALSWEEEEAAQPPECTQEETCEPAAPVESDEEPEEENFC